MNTLDIYTTYISIQQCVITCPHHFFVGMPSISVASLCIRICVYLGSWLLCSREYIQYYSQGDTMEANLLERMKEQLLRHEGM